MSLLVRLPLNGNLNNYGSADVTVTNNGATISNDGKLGKCYSFDGNDDYISISSSTINTLLSGTNPFTLSMWTYHADATRAILFGDYGTSGTINFNIELNTSHQVRFYWGGDPDWTATSKNIGINTWSHIAIVYDTTQLSLYINGELSNTRNGVLSTKNKTSGSFYLGRDSRTGTTALNGRLNDFRIYDNALTESEIKHIINGKGLQIWLPLNGDLTQQGLSNATVTNNSSVSVDDSGKIGKCYYFNRTNYLTTPIPFSTTTSMSLAFWIKIPETYNSNQQIIHIGKGSGWVNNRFIALIKSSTYQIVFHISDGTNTISYNCISTALTQNEWTHVSCTYENHTMKIYINGILNKTYTISYDPSFTDITNIGYGAAPNGQEKGKMYLNDIRIYDYCLSEKEVKEISKGLVLHYKLSGTGGENLLPCGGTYTKDSPWSTTSNKIDGYTWVTNSAFEATPSTTYTISVECDGNLISSHATSSAHSSTNKDWTFWLYISNTDTTKSWQTGSYDTPVNLTSANHNYRKIGNTHVWTYTLSSTQKYISLRTNSYSDGSTNLTVNWWNMKIEEGDKFTPWVPNVSSPKYTTMGYDNNIEYDLSGYKNNGTKVGTITYTSDTPKYNCSTHFNSTSSYIQATNLTTVGFGNSYSFAWWGKRSSNSPMFWGFSNGIRLNGMYGGTLWNTGDGSNNPIYKPDTTTTITAPSVNVWHHYVMTGDGTTCKLYLDGELYGQAKTYKAISGTTIIINGWDTSTSYSSDNYSISDFRIYATVLSADDIQALYQAGRS